MTCPKFWSFSVPTFWIWQISCSNSLSLAQLCVFCMDDVWESAAILSLFLFAFPLRQEAGVEVTGHLSPANSLDGSIFKWGEKKKIRGKWKKYSPILLSRKKRDGGARLKNFFSLFFSCPRRKISPIYFLLGTKKISFYACGGGAGGS